MRNDPSRISIDMVFQGTASEIDPTSNTGKMIHSATEKSSKSQETAGSAGIKHRVMEELQAGKQPEPAGRPTNGTHR
jgi:ABC-type dipeptide/oligopeptide/nickel transport system ATPase component